LNITLLEATSKKTEFLRAAVVHLELASCHVKHARAEEYGQGEGRGRYDIVISRAVAELRLLVELGVPLLRQGGQLLAMKGPLAEQELQGARGAISAVGGWAEDGVEGEGVNSLVKIIKEGETPPNFPRPWGQIKHRPL